MKNKDKIILEKVINYINEIQEFINGYSQEQFNNDKKLLMHVFLI